MSQKLASIGKTMTMVGGTVTAAFGAIIMKTTQLGDTYDKMSKRTNIAVEELSALGYAAKISGADLDTVEKSLRYLARGMNDASMGIGEAKEAFKELNISVTDSVGNLRPTMDVLKEAATKLAAMTDETKQVALATDIFGARYGTQLLPLLKEGGEGIEALMNKAKDLGIVMSTEAAAKAAEFNDRLTDLKESVGGMGRSIGEILIPPLIEFAEKAVEIIKKIKDWAEAHKPLVDIIVKVGATLGALAAAGGPILLAASALIKMKGAITALQAVIVLWKQVFEELNKVLHSSHTSLNDVTAAENILAEAQQKLADKLGISVEQLKEYQKQGKSLSEMVGKELVPNTEKANETFSLNVKVTGKMGAGVEAATKSFKDMGKEVQNSITQMQNDFIPAMQAVEDTIYRLTHTEYETTLRNINREYDALIEKAKTLHYTEEELENVINKINQARQLEIEALNKSNEAKDETIEKNEEIVESNEKIVKSNEKIADSIEPVIEKTKEATEVAVQAGILGGEAWDGFTTAINRARISMTNFTKEGLAATIATIKMKFYPILQDLYASLENAGQYAFLIQGQINNVLKMQAEQIATATFGLEAYQQVLASLGGGGGNSSSFNVPAYASGTPYVPKTGLALLHKGEAVIPANQNTYNTFSPSISMTVQGGGDANRIAQEVEKVLYNVGRQFKRRGFEIIPGRG
ncbi:MAG: phage tail tape measure protein [Candidatus Heimdallarchaeaceae archaeon]